MEMIEESRLHPALPKSTFFHVGQDIKRSFSTSKNIYQSTIKKDYPAYGLSTKQSRLPSPEPSKIFSVDSRINEQKSLTSTHFVKKTADPVVLTSDLAKLVLGTKNLVKMDIDDRSRSFETTHKVYFPPRILEKFQGKQNRMKSYIPQGDKEKVTLPLSNYKQSYQEDQLSKLDVSLPAQFVTAPFLRGDIRSYDDQFETTNHKTFGAQRNAPEKLQVIKNNGCSIRHGDPDKCRYSVTTNQKFFGEKPLERVEPCGPNYVSSIVFGDDRGEWSNYGTSSGRCSLPQVIQTQHLKAKIAKLNMAKSSVPVGDLDPNRTQQRITQTTNNSFLRKPNVQSPYAKVNGSYLLTKSQVKFGTENAVTQNHYNTTTKSNFSAKPALVNRRNCQATNSDVCLDYYAGNESNHSTTFLDFCPHDGAKRLLPNPKGLAKVTDSHIQLPKTLTSEFLTSHSISYPQKWSKRETYEPGRLHKSSIKLGNISVH